MFEPKPYEGAEISQHRFGLTMPKNPYNNFLFDHIDGFEFLLIFLALVLSYFPLFQETQLPAPRHSAVLIIALA